MVCGRLGIGLRIQDSKGDKQEENGQEIRKGQKDGQIGGESWATDWRQLEIWAAKKMDLGISWLGHIKMERLGCRGR